MVILDDEAHLWSMEICSAKLYVLKKVNESIIPRYKEDFKNILAIRNLVWQLKVREQKYKQRD